MKRADVFLLALVLFLGVVLRLYKINIPLADLHSWRQADTAAVARNFTKSGFDLLHPRYDDLSNVQSGMDNPEGYRMVEFPIYNAVFAKLYQIWPVFSLEVWGRIVSIFFSLIVMATIYYLTLKESSRVAAFFASFVYAVFPFFVFFSRVVLPESTALGFSMLAIFFLYLLPKKTRLLNLGCYLLSIAFFALALLTKPTTIFFSLPLVYLAFKHHGWKVVKTASFYLYFLLAVLPLLFWRSYILKYPEGIPVAEWLLTSVNVAGGLQPIFFRPAFFRWIFFERINNLILGGLASAFLILGTLLKQKNKFLTTILLASLAYVFVFQGGNVQHEYYQTLILPALAIFVGLGIDAVFQNKKVFSRPLAYFAIPLILALSWFFSFYTVRNYYNYSTELVQTANIISSLTSPEDLIVTDTTGDTTLLYLAGRRGAPAVYKDPFELKNLGYKFITTNNFGMVDQLTEGNFELLFKNEKFAVFKL